MVVGDGVYQLNLSRLAFNFRGALSMDYLQCATIARIRELTGHVQTISKELESNG